MTKSQRKSLYQQFTSLTYVLPLPITAYPIVKLETISLIKETFHSYEDDQWKIDTYEQDILTFEVPTHKSRWIYPMSLLTPKLITNETVPMDHTANSPDPLDPILKVTERSIISSADHPIRSNGFSQRLSSLYLMGKSIGARVNESAGRRLASPRPRD